MAQIIRLECTTGGHNKFYKMTENGDGTFTARYGAIGTLGATKTYPMSKWPSIYNEKIRKGYIHLPNQPMYQRPSKNSGGPKYGFTGETRIIPGTTRTAYRIVSRIDFTAGDGSEVHAGDKGGWAEQDGLLSQNVDDSSWVADEAKREMHTERYSARNIGVLGFYGRNLRDRQQRYAIRDIARMAIVWNRPAMHRQCF